MTNIVIMRKDWERRGIGGRRAEADFTVYVASEKGSFRCRGYSSHGDMAEGYWGSITRASQMAEQYAAGLASTLGISIKRARYKDGA
jgi:hypothetical protein